MRPKRRPASVQSVPASFRFAGKARKIRNRRIF
jgi:hypothetical protein